MKPESTKRGGDPLHDALQAWKVSASLPPGFQDRVWRKIAHQETPSTPFASRFGMDWLTRWRGFIIQPAGTAAYLCALLVVGVGLGYWQSENYTSRAERAWRTAYVQSVNPNAAGFAK